MSYFLAAMLVFSSMSPAAFAEDEAAEATAEAETDASVTTDSPEASEETSPYSGKFTDLADLTDTERAIFDSLIRKGIFNGVSEDTFGVDQPMNRAQFAKVAALIFGLEVDTALTTSSFADVSADDPANGYALPYIEAIKKAGLTNGADPTGTTYNPAGTVTREELATFLIRGMGLEEQAKTTFPLDDPTISLWAQGYVALAVDKNIIQLQSDGTFGGSTAATRKTLALTAFASSEAMKPDKVSIVEAKMAGAKKLSVKMNRDVDTELASFVVTSGEDSVFTQTEWNATGDEAVVSFEENPKEGTYKVAIAGLEADQVDAGSVEFTAEAEVVKSLEIISSSDKLPRSKVLLQVKQVNQYGEAVESRSKASDLQITVGAKDRNVQYDADTRSFIINLKDEMRETRIPVTIIDQGSYLSVNRTFTVGDDPLISKLELGNIIFEGTQTNFTPGTRAHLPFKAYDQYGNRIIDKDVLNGNMGIRKYVTGDQNVLKEEAGANPFVLYDDDYYPEYVVEINSGLKGDKEITLNLFGGSLGAPVSKKITVLSPKTPATVEFGTISLYDGSAGSFGITVKDSTGYALTADELIEAEENGQIRIYSNGGIVLESNEPTRTGKDDVSRSNLTIVTSGDDKGKVKVKTVKGQGPMWIYVDLPGKTQPIMQSVTVNAKKKVTGVKLKSSSTELNIALPGTTKSKGPKFDIIDQYGNVMNTEIYAPDADFSKYRVKVMLEKLSGDWSAIKEDTYKQLNETTPEATKLLKEFADWEIKFKNGDNGKTGTFRFTATVVEVDGSERVIRTIGDASARIEAPDVNNADLDVTYDLAINDTYTLYAAGQALYDRKKVASATDATYLFMAEDDLVKAGLGIHRFRELKQPFEMKVKDRNGKEIELGNLRTPMIKMVTTSQPEIVGFKSDYSQIIGLKPGKVVVTAHFQALDGTMKSVSKEVTVVNEPLKILTFELGESEATLDAATRRADDVKGGIPWDSHSLDRLWLFSQEKNLVLLNQSKFRARDQFNHSIDVWYKHFRDMVHMEFYISNVKYKEGTPDAQKDKVYIEYTTGQIDSYSGLYMEQAYEDPITKKKRSNIGPRGTEDYRLRYIHGSGKTDPEEENITQFTIYVAVGTNLYSKTIHVK